MLACSRTLIKALGFSIFPCRPKSAGSKVNCHVAIYFVYKLYMYVVLFSAQWFNMDVDAVLAGRQGQYRTTEVEKEVELQFDLGNLLATDLNAVDTDALR